MSIKNLTTENIEEILERYKNGEPTKSIAQHFNIDQSYISHIANKHGLRRANTYTKSSNTSKWVACHACGKSNPPEARYCMFCASDVRSEKDKIADSLERVRELCLLLPKHARDEVDAITRTAIKFMRVGM